MDAETKHTCVYTPTLDDFCVKRHQSLLIISLIRWLL